MWQLACCYYHQLLQADGAVICQVSGEQCAILLATGSLTAAWKGWSDHTMAKSTSTCAMGSASQAMHLSSQGRPGGRG